MNETVYAIQYNNNSESQAIGLITEAVYQMIYNDTDMQETQVNKSMNRLEKTLYTTSYTVYKLARELHRVQL